MTKEELFEKHFKRIEKNLNNGESGCDETHTCGECYLQLSSRCFENFKNDFIIFKRKKKLEKLLS